MARSLSGPKWRAAALGYLLTGWEANEDTEEDGLSKVKRQRSGNGRNECFHFFHI